MADGVASFLNPFNNFKVICGAFIGSLCLCVVLYKYNRLFRFYVKWIFFHLVAMTNAALVCFLSFFKAGDPNNLHGYNHHAAMSCRILGIEATASGLEHFNQDTNYVVMCNHQSTLDVMIMSKFIPARTTVLAKWELLFLPFLGVAMWICGVAFIKRSNSQSARAVMDKLGKRMKEENFNVWIYPEGTRSQTDSMIPFKKGGFHLAQQAQIPIIPAIISNQKSFFDLKKKRFEKGRMHMTVLPPVHTKGLTKDDVNSLVENVRNQMLEVYLKNENTQPTGLEKNDKKSS